MRFVRLPWITKGPGRAWVGSVPNKHNPSTKSGQDACISSRITMVIHVMNDHQINDNCFNEPFAVSPCRSLYWDMHGLIFETSIWLLAGSTRLILCHRRKGSRETPRLPSHGGLTNSLATECRRPPQGMTPKESSHMNSQLHFRTRKGKLNNHSRSRTQLAAALQEPKT